MDGNVLIWDLNTEAPINIINGPMISGEGLDMNCYGDGEKIILYNYG